MGAWNFAEYREGQDPREAFGAAVEKARWESGHGGYTGTILLAETLGEKGSFIEIRDRGVLPLREAHRFADKLTEDGDRRIDDKWGPAGAIPVSDEGKIRTRTITLTLDTELGGSEVSGYAGVAAAVREALDLGGSEFVEGIEVVEQKPRVKIETEATKGKAVTRYVVEGAWGAGGPYATQAEARKAMTEALVRTAHADEARVVARVEREDGSPLVVARRKVTNRAKLRVKIRTMPPGAKITGWLFFGWASS